MNEQQKQWTRENQLVAYYADGLGATPNELRFTAVGTPVDKPLSDFGGDVEACIASVVTDAIAFQQQ